MRATDRPNYERPRIETVPARRIVELMGPVSCGSGGVDALPTAGGLDVVGGSSRGLKKFD